MTARVITDPSALGWVLDPDTGRWEWSGSGGGGVEEAPEDGIQYARQDAAWSPIESAGGDPWEILHEIDLAGVSMLDYPDIFTDDHISYRVEMRSMFFPANANITSRAYNNGTLITSSYGRSVFDPDGVENSASFNEWRHNDRLTTPQGFADLVITFSGARPNLSAGRTKQPYLVAESIFNTHASKRRQVAVGGCYMQQDWGDWTGFQISSATHDSGKALIYGLRN
jgi:hypothetical protein